jgi:hypothetical protein
MIVLAIYPMSSDWQATSDIRSATLPVTAVLALLAGVLILIGR